LSALPVPFTLWVVFGVGSILAGKYRIERMIGEGGMGMVVAATHLHLGTQVALKFLHQDMAMNQQMTERFLREARASALLKSEHVCRVSDVGTLENGAPYIVMELLAGHDLASLLRHQGPMSINTACEYVLQALVALAEAHGAGIVHRDLKRGNLFWTQRPDGTALVKVLDFGIAKAPGSVNFSLTQTSTVMGSPGYMSPEQLKSSKEVDARSDIWSIGILLYELVTGRTPFAGESITELALRVAMDPTPTLPPHFPPTFQAIIARCLEKDPQRRYQDVAELAAALAPFGGARGYDIANGVTRVLRGHNAAPVVPQSMGAGQPTPPPETRPPTSPVLSTPTTLGGASGAVVTIPPRGNRALLIGGVVGLSAVGVVIGVVLATRGGGSDKPSTPAASPTTPTQSEVAAEPPAAADAGVASAPTPPPPADAAVAATPPPPVVDAGIAATTQRPDAKTTKPPRKRPPRKRPVDVGDSRE
jgi:serine/threonine-protein kinase